MQQNERTIKNFYTILGLSEHATVADLKHAYRTWARRFHPDLHPNDSLAAKKFRLLHIAYATLLPIIEAKEKERKKKVSEPPTNTAPPKNTAKKAVETAKEGGGEQKETRVPECPVAEEKKEEEKAEEKKESIYEMQVFHIDCAELVPGTHVRIKVCVEEEEKNIDIVLPKNYVYGQALRLRGLGRQIGPWREDVYVRLER